MFGERLRLARKREGLSLRALAALMDGIVSAQAIGKYERGQMMPGSTVAIALSKTLKVSMRYLLSPFDHEGVEFRKQTPAKVRERAMVESAVLDHVDRYLQIEELLDVDAHWERPSGSAYRVHALEDAEQAAEAVRSDWSLGGIPIPNMTELLEGRGIKVLRLVPPPSFDGLTCSVRRGNGKDVPVVVCTTGKSIERQRFTLARELGHMLLEIPSGLNEEKACRRFAGAFLAPRKGLLDQFGRKRRAFGCVELIEIKRMFGISATTLVFRLRDIGVIKEAALGDVFSGIGRTWKKEEPAPLDRDEPAKRFRRLCLRALAEDVISMSKVVELLELSTSRIEEIMSGPACD